MLRTITAMKRDEIGKKLYEKYGQNVIFDNLLKKFKDGNIPDITDFRYLTKIIKQHKIAADIRERILTKVLTVSDYRIDEAYDLYARTQFESKTLEKQLDRIEVIIEEIQIDSLDKGDSIVFLTNLQNFRKILESKITILEKKLGKATATA
jgi:hypothetical protein